MSENVTCVVTTARQTSSTPSSSDDVEPDQINFNTSDSGDYEACPALQNKKPVDVVHRNGGMGDNMASGGHPARDRCREKNSQQVTIEARRVLERFLRIADEMSRRRERRVWAKAGAGGQDSAAEGSGYEETEHQYAIVEEIFHDLLPTPYQPMGSDDEDREVIEAKQAQELVDNFQRLMTSAESDYVDCQMLASEGKEKSVESSAHHKRSGGDSRLTLALIKNQPVCETTLRSARTRSPPGSVKFAVKKSTSVAEKFSLTGLSHGSDVSHAAAVKTPVRKNVKKKNIADKPVKSDNNGGSSSSSTEDYEIPDIELLNRKKKSGFRLAIERVQQSFRRGMSGAKKSSLSVGGTPTSSWAKTDVPLPEPPCTESGTEAWLRTLASTSNRHHKDMFLHRNVSVTSKVTNSSGSPGDVSAERRISKSRGTAESAEEAVGVRGAKSPLPWFKRSMRDVRKGGTIGEESEKERNGKDEGLFDGLLKHIRKGSAKFRNKGHRVGGNSLCRSADNLSLKPLSKDDRRLLDQYVVSATTVTGSAARRCDTAMCDIDSDTERFRCLADVATPRLVRGSQHGQSGCHSLRQRLVLDDLVACRPTARRDGLLTDVSNEATQRDSTQDDVDAASKLTMNSQSLLNAITTRSSSRPFHEKSDGEKEDLLEKIAEQLAVIADQYGGFDVTALHVSSSTLTAAVQQPAALGGRSQAEQLDGLIPRQTGDAMAVDPMPAVTELVHNTASYGKFKQIVSANVDGFGVGEGETASWHQIARTFRLTQSAVQLAGLGTQVARQIKEMTIRYFEDRFADWIVGQGGWESMVEDTNTENDSELD